MSLFSAGTTALVKIEALGAPIMEQAIKAYRQVAGTNEFREIERLRSRARHNEASALGHARRTEREKWQSVVVDLRDSIAEKDALVAEKDALIAELRTRLGENK